MVAVNGKRHRDEGKRFIFIITISINVCVYVCVYVCVCVSETRKLLDTARSLHHYAFAVSLTSVTVSVQSKYRPVFHSNRQFITSAWQVDT
jgi:hypothetical protein